MKPRGSAAPGPSPPGTESLAVPAPLARALAEELARWFERARRELPWRRRREAYAIWVSEIMLQQTTVAAVIPFYERFLARFPTVEALAEAPLEAVLERWAGLGYYRRARHLHACARAVVADHAGSFPRTVEGLLALPGIGPYTAGAIASIAFDVPAPLVDGNVARVLARLFRVEGDPRAGEARRRLWALAAALVPERGASVHNQALMELGALVCLPGAVARCAVCPLAARCSARTSGEVERFPELAPRAPIAARRDLALLFVREGRALYGRRPDAAVWGGLFELPRVTLLEGESDADAARRLGRELLGAGSALAPPPGAAPVARTSHTVMRERIELRVFRGTLRGAERRAGYAELRWVTAAEIEALPLPSPQRKIAAAVGARLVSERGR